MLVVFSIKGSRYKEFFKGGKLKTLSYVLASNNSPITLDLYEAERYAPAVIVQQLVGNLVYYSNNGRYEPRISESWQRVSPTQWDFKIKKGFSCENGEAITPKSFRLSLMRSIKAAAKNGNVPVFNKLIGFNEMINSEKGEFLGIVAAGDIISFHFTVATRSGPLQLLSFAPFGYICEENLNPDLSWKDKLKFISSGPYKIEKVDIGNEYVLVKRKEWSDFSQNSPDKVIINHKTPKFEKEVNHYTIVDSITPLDNIPTNLKSYNLVPEYLIAISLGNVKKGFFASLDNRQVLNQAIQEIKKKNINRKSNVSYSPFFYPSQQRIKATIPALQINKPKTPIIIEGKVPEIDSPKYSAYQILIAAFDFLKWEYKINNNEFTWKDYSNQDYDVRLLAPSVGSGVEAWGIDVIFFSPVGVNLPDPSGRVKNMLSDYENDKITDQELTDNFLEAVDEDSAILPISHLGLQWYISSGINTSSISPLISIIRFDQVELE